MLTCKHRLHTFIEVQFLRPRLSSFNDKVPVTDMTHVRCRLEQRSKLPCPGPAWDSTHLQVLIKPCITAPTTVIDGAGEWGGCRSSLPTHRLSPDTPSWVWCLCISWCWYVLYFRNVMCYIFHHVDVLYFSERCYILLDVHVLYITKVSW